MAALEAQASQLGLQASQERQRLGEERSAVLQALQREKERLAELERRYHSLTGGRGFPRSSSAMREVSGRGAWAGHVTLSPSDRVASGGARVGVVSISC